MNRLNKKEAQALIEYAIVVTLITVAVATMSTYVFRSVQSTQKAVQSAVSNQ